MTRSGILASRLLVALVTAALTAGAALAVAVGASATASGGLAGETLTFPLAGRYDDCPAGATSYAFTLEGEADGPWPGHYTGRVSARTEGGEVINLVEATIDTPDGALLITGTGADAAGPSGVCAPLRAGQVLTWTADVPGHGADSGTTVLSGDPDVLVAQLTSAAPDGPTTTEAPTPTDDPSSSPADPADPATPSPPASGAPSGGPRADRDLAFRYRVVARGGETSGSCDVLGGTQQLPVHIVCIDVRSYQRHGRTVRFAGAATINGLPTSYQIRIVDGGGSGEGGDSFVISVGDDYVGGGDLTSGDLRVR